MVLYNLGAAVILAAFGIESRRVGVALWPAVVLHTAMTVWSIVSVLYLSGADEPENNHK